MAFLNETLIDEIKSANDIVDIVSEYVTDKKTEITEKKVAEALKKYNLLDTATESSDSE